MKTLIFLIFFTGITSFGQNYQIDYKFSLLDTKDEYGVVGFGITRLITNETESMSYAKNIDTVAVIKGMKEPHSQTGSEFGEISEYKGI